MSIPAIAVKNLVKKFGDTTVLHGIDLEIPQGQVSCLIGPSGSGKSTLLRCMAFLEEATTRHHHHRRRSARLYRECPRGTANACRPRQTAQSAAGSAWSSSSSISGRT